MASPSSSPITSPLPLLLLTTLFHCAHPKVSMWIGEDEVRAFAGVPMEINIIERDKLADYVRRGPEFTAGLPPIPPLADSINVTWTSGKGKGPKGKYSYKFLQIRAEDPTIMEGLKLSIPHSGFIPRRPTDFRVSLPCTGQKAGIANFKLIFEVRDQTGKPLDGSPIRLKLAKYCRLQNETCLVQKCDNGGVCTPYGDCLCQKGFVGRRCEYSANCRDDCNRRGVCIRDDICKCRPGFRGKYCQRRAKSRGTGGKGRGGGRRKGGKGKNGGSKKYLENKKLEGSTVPARVTNEVEVHPGTTTPVPPYGSSKKRRGGKKKSRNGKKKQRKGEEVLELEEQVEERKVGKGTKESRKQALEMVRDDEEESGKVETKVEEEEMAKKRDRKAERKDKRKNRRRKKQKNTNVTSPSKM